MDYAFCKDTGKRSFSKKDAQTVLHQMAKSRKLNKQAKRVYHCDYCNMWHITSQYKAWDWYSYKKKRRDRLEKQGIFLE